jgi:hypothetical protein
MILKRASLPVLKKEPVSNKNQALVYSNELAASNIASRYVPIHNLTSGVMFIATPHGSSLMQTFIENSQVNAFLLDLFGYRRKLRALQSGTEVIKRENEEFVQLAMSRGFPVVSAYET